MFTLTSESSFIPGVIALSSPRYKIAYFITLVPTIPSTGHGMEAVLCDADNPNCWSAWYNFSSYPEDIAI